MTKHTESEYTHTQACRDVWAGLSRIDCSEHVKNKNGLSYLSWAWAYQIMMENYPSFSFQFDELVMYQDYSAEVRVKCVLEHNGQLITKNMWLPVMDHRNKPIMNPDSVAINKAKMRCLTKAISLYGLGAYIYAGEDLPSSDDAPIPVDVPVVPVQPAPVVVDTRVEGPGIEYPPVQSVQPDMDVKNPVIADEQGAEELVSVLVGIARNMHTGNMSELADFWRQNKATIDVLDAKFPAQYQKLKAAFTELKSSLTQ